MNAILCAPQRVSRQAFRLWKYFESLARYGGWIAPKLQHLVDKYGRARSTVQRWLGELFAAGIISTKRRGPYSPLYTVLIPTTDTCKQPPLFTEPEEPEGISDSVWYSSRERLQHHPEDAEPSHEVELQRLAGLPGKISRGDRAFLDALQQPADVLRAGVLLGRARKLAQNATSGRNEVIRSLRYFSGSIAEVARDLPKSLLAWYPGHLQKDVDRMMRKAKTA